MPNASSGHTLRFQFASHKRKDRVNRYEVETVFLHLFTRRRRPNVLRGLATGITAGIAATLIMDQFQKISTAGQKAVEKQMRLANHQSAEAIELDQQRQEQQAKQHEDSTQIVARKIAETAGKELAPEQKKKGGQAVHYAFGTLMGAVYGVASELVPEVTTGGGTAYGTLLFLGASEVAVPAFQLSPPPTETPARDHLQHWAAHVVYGGSLELVRSLMRRFM
jgi:putative membrane protein